ncbi:MAG: hypothetical protein LBV40_04915 [Methanomicrobiales archaeon]|jgi:hypothetical protein|nr:hypothetical protein [Methanomicrobiales archaeon]
MLNRGISQILYIILMGICFIGVPSVSDSVASIVEPKFGIFGDEVIITIVSDTGLFSSAQAILFMNEGGEVIKRMPVIVVSSTTVYASISKLDIDPGTYTLTLDVGAEEPLLLETSFMVQAKVVEEIEPELPVPTTEPLIKVVPIEPSNSIITLEPTTILTPELPPLPTAIPTPEQTQTPTSYTITAQAEYGGVINPAGQIAVEPNGAQEFVIIPDMGYIISNLIIDGKAVDPISVYTFELVTDDHMITAQFGVEVPPAPEGKVSIVTDSDIHTKISPSGSLFVDKGTPLTFTIKAVPGSEYTTLRSNGNEMPPEKVLRIIADTNYVIQSRGWYEGEQSENVPEQTDAIVQAEEEMTYTIVSRADAGGTIEPFGEVSITAGSSQTFLIVPEQGYQVKAVLIDGIGVGGTTEYTFENVQESHSIRALFGR